MNLGKTSLAISGSPQGLQAGGGDCLQLPKQGVCSILIHLDSTRLKKPFPPAQARLRHVLRNGFVPRPESEGELGGAIERCYS